MPINSSQFVQTQIANAAGTLQDISTYLNDASPKRTSADTDLTTFAASGNPVTKTHIRGALMSEFTLKGFYDPAYARIIRQIVGARSGVAFKQKAGSNNLPAQGDEVFNGTYCPISFTLVYNFGNPATLDVDLKLADGAGAPGFGQI